MSTHAYAFRDSVTMLRRNLKQMVRYPSASLLVVGLPVILLLLFVYVFGGTMGAGLGVVSGGRAAYVNYVTPGIILIAVASVAQGTAIAISMDMADGIIARFRTMGISRGAVLTGHVLASTIQTLLGLAAVIGVALAIGFRPNAGPGRSGSRRSACSRCSRSRSRGCRSRSACKAKSVEAASNVAMPLFLLVFIGSGFVPTDSMPAALRGFAGVPAVHVGHRDAPRAPHGDGDRARRRAGRRLVRGDRLRRIPVGDAALRPRSLAAGPAAQRRSRVSFAFRAVSNPGRPPTADAPGR